ncbi:apolipoprotein N-acyltransferase [Thermomonospora umbrina]|uniref:Apolipoprotein N-acyltransferase n=1 Tax=Thermomonospora umbrina TaxID=111806 RepID=A0A3D9SZA9_9ACTN|nr:apolipoprotein N-acyltransferase [Thermomonospora umbrina]REF00918.1 apolipoprotein N-acyltransferase [Thermomonospora umbrina]
MAQDTVPERHSADPPPRGAGRDRPDRRDRPGRFARLRRGGRAGWPRTLTAIAAGLLMWPAFPPYDLWPLAPVGVALLTIALHGLPGRAATWPAFWAGAAFFLPALSGIVKIGPDAWLLLGLVQAAYFAPMGAGIALVTRLRGWPVWTAALWVAQEFVRGRAPFGGFPWARLVFSQTDAPFTPYAAVGGAPLVTFLTALTGGLIAYAVLRGPLPRALAGRLPAVERRGPRAAAAAVAGVLLVGAVGLLVPLPTEGRPINVAVVQGNVPRLGLDFNGQRRAVLENHVRRTHELAARYPPGSPGRPELVIWPENSSDLDPYTEPEARELIDGAVRAVGVPVLVGAVVDAADGEHVENRGIVWDPRTGPGDHYVKRHPVPFGEYLPFRSVLTKLITRFERIPRDFAKGERPGMLKLGPAVIGDVICFEVAYDGVVRDVADAELLVVQTNNATYGRTSLPPQQVAMSRLRAVEHGRSVLVAATSGISAIVAPDGRMIDRSAEFVPDVQVAAVPARTTPTLADRMGSAPEGALTLLGLAAAAAAARTARTRTARTSEGA